MPSQPAMETPWRPSHHDLHTRPRHALATGWRSRSCPSSSGGRGGATRIAPGAVEIAPAISGAGRGAILTFVGVVAFAPGRNRDEKGHVARARHGTRRIAVRSRLFRAHAPSGSAETDAQKTVRGRKRCRNGET